MMDVKTVVMTQIPEMMEAMMILQTQVVTVEMVKLQIVMDLVNVGQSHGLVMDLKIVKINSLVLT